MFGASILRCPLGTGNNFNRRVHVKLQIQGTATSTTLKPGNIWSIQDLKKAMTRLEILHRVLKILYIGK